MGTSSGSGPDIISPDRQNQLHTVSTQLYPPLCNTRTADTAAPGKGKTKANKGNKASNKTSAEIELEFSKYQNNITQAKIRDQEVTIKDLKFRNNILESRVADLEGKQKQDSYDRYFPHPKDAKTSQESVRHEANSCCSGSHRAPLVISWCSGHHSVEGPGKDNKNDFQEIVKKFDDLKADLHNVKNRVDILSDVSIPRVIRQVLQSIALPTHTPDAAEAGPSTRYIHSSKQPSPQPDLNTSCMTVDDAENSSQDLN